MFKKKKKTASSSSDDFFGPKPDTVTADRSADDGDTTNSLKELVDQPEWIDQEEEEGQLAVDVYEEDDAIIVKSTIAGVETEDVDISITNDMLTIRGERKRDKTSQDREYFFQECYWGGFSRSIILPVEIDTKKIDATIKNGILTVVLPKLELKGKKNIKIKDED